MDCILAYFPPHFTSFTQLSHLFLLINHLSHLSRLILPTNHIEHLSHLILFTSHLQHLSLHPRNQSPTLHLHLKRFSYIISSSASSLLSPTPFLTLSTWPFSASLRAPHSPATCRLTNHSLRLLLTQVSNSHIIFRPPAALGHTCLASRPSHLPHGPLRPSPAASVLRCLQVKPPTRVTTSPPINIDF